jgi:RNA polymerase sigma factor (sigma-70 family)
MMAVTTPGELSMTTATTSEPLSRVRHSLSKTTRKSAPGDRALPTVPARRRAIEFIPSPEFETATAADEILPELPERSAQSARPSVPAGTPAYLAALYETPLLTPAEERHLFRRYNFLKFQAEELLARCGRGAAAARRRVAADQRLARAADDRDRLIRANLRLVVANARLFATPDHPFEELVSDGNLSLMQAVEKFDYRRGFRFSTYATHAIRRTIFRRVKRSQRDRSRFALHQGELLEAAPGREGAATHDPAEQWLARQLAARMSERLNERELSIVRARFDFLERTEPPTLQVLARELGICKERVRQLQNRAIEKLRLLALEIRAQFPPESVMLDAVRCSASEHEDNPAERRG